MSRGNSLALVFPAPLISPWAYAGVVAGDDGTGGAAVKTSIGAVAVTDAAVGLLRGPQQVAAPAPPLAEAPLAAPPQHQ